MTNMGLVLLLIWSMTLENWAIVTFVFSRSFSVEWRRCQSLFLVLELLGLYKFFLKKHKITHLYVLALLKDRWASFFGLFVLLGCLVSFFLFIFRVDADILLDLLHIWRLSCLIFHLNWSRLGLFKRGSLPFKHLPLSGLDWFWKNPWGNEAELWNEKHFSLFAATTFHSLTS